MTGVQTCALPIYEEQQIYAETIIASGQHLLEIINDILALSKIEAGKLELENQKFDLLTLVDEIVISFTSQTRQKDLLFVCLFDPSRSEARRVGKEGRAWGCGCG